MGTEVVHPLIKAAEEELQLALAEKAEIDRRKTELDMKVAALARAIEDLRQVYGVPGSVSSDLSQWTELGLGITDQVRDVLKRLKLWMVPTGIRSMIRNKQALQGYSNPMAVIHQVLRRLEDQGEIESKEAANGKKLYRWKQQK